VDAGGGFALGAFRDSTMFGLGYNSYGQLGLDDSLTTHEHVGSTTTSFKLHVPSQLAVDAGQETVVAIEVERLGGFTLDGPGFSKPITLKASGGSAGVTLTFETEVLGPGQTTALLHIRVDAAGGSRTVPISIEASAPGAETQSGTLSVASSAVLPKGSALNLVCKDGSSILDHVAGSPDRYQCMAASSGTFAPGQFAGPAVAGLAGGVWMDKTVGVCIYWGQDAPGHANAQTGFVRAQNGGNSLSGPQNSKPSTWGVLVDHLGKPEGGNVQWLVFTDSADPQIRGLMYDVATQRFPGWNFTHTATCAW
jgi:hypothetical protein